MRVRDERYLFHLPPWGFFPLWFTASMAASWLLEDAPVWLVILVGAPVGWTMPFYVARMPMFRRSAGRRRPGP